MRGTPKKKNDQHNSKGSWEGKEKRRTGPLVRFPLVIAEHQSGQRATKSAEGKKRFVVGRRS